MNNSITKEKIEKLADLLMIGLTEDETQMVLDEFEEIDKNINLINEIPDIESVEPMTHTLDNFESILREDDIEVNDELKDLLSNCDNYDNGEVIVPKVVGEEC